jgi:hypothetical protein
MDEGAADMSQPVPASRPTPIRVPVLAWLALAVAVVVVYLLLQENGLVLTHRVADYLHEFTHDGRHALGVPCH